MCRLPLLLLLICSAAALAQQKPAAARPPASAPPPTYDDPAKADADFSLQGEYAGKMRDADFALQVIAQGDGKFDAVLCPGGLPGAGWTMQPNPRQRVAGKRANDSVRFGANGWSGLLKDGVIALQDFKGTPIGTLNRVERQSPTLGAAPGAGAVVLFGGKGVTAFKEGARMTPDGLLMEGCMTKEEFGDCTVHIEFRLPYMPASRGQGRGNSGLYLAGRYEVQMLDSFGLNGENNECGGIYTVAKPKVNMCLPPLVWQTYDIEFTAPRFEGGRKTADAEITVKHNGVLVHEKVKVPGPTRAAPISKEGAQGPLYLQNHGNPMRYRNVWVVRK